MSTATARVLHAYDYRRDELPADVAPWTRSQLEHRLLAAAGAVFRGKDVRVDTRRAAVLLGVSERTLRRWLHGSPDEVVGMSAGSRAAVWAALRPSAKKVRQEALDRAYARDAIRQIGLPPRRRRVPKEWVDRGWLDQHMVAVIDIPSAHAKQVTFARMDHRPLQRMQRRGELVDFTVVDTRFHATVLVGAVLELVEPWRVKLAGRWTKQGPGQGWMVDDQAPTVDLAALAVTNDLR